MKRRALLAVFLNLILSACSIGANQPSPDIVSKPHQPLSTLDLQDLSSYVLAYCWRPPKRDEFGRGSTMVIIEQGDKSQQVILELEPPETTTRYMVACFYTDEEGFRAGNYSLSWRPEHNQIVATSGSDIAFSSFHIFEYVDVFDIDPIGQRLTEHKDFFSRPNGINWASDGSTFLTLGMDSGTGNIGLNVWEFDIDKETAERVTNFNYIGNPVSQAVHSNNNQLIAISHGFPTSGVGINNPEGNYLAVSNNNEALLLEWPYSIESMTDFFWNALSKNPLVEFQNYLIRSSNPIWMNNGEDILFIAPTSGNRVSLFVVDKEGNNLRELLPELEGLNGLPRLSPNGQHLAFVRYPGWKNTTRAEIAVIDLEALSYKSLVVIEEPANGDRLYISGLDWSPDGKYLAFSSNHEGLSNLYVVAKDGDAWLNLTSELEGDAVNPVWKP